MKSEEFQLVFVSDINLVREVVKKALDFVSSVFPNANYESVTEIKLILYEAVINAVQHGNRENKSKKVTLKIKASKDMLLIKVKDEGDGFNLEEYLQLQKKEKISMRENGRGIRMVLCLSEEVKFNQKGNEVHIYKRVVSNG